MSTVARPASRRHHRSSARRRRLRPLSILGACIRRDAANAWSYRLPFVWQLIESFTALFMLFFLSRLVGDRIEVVAKTRLTGGYFSFAVVGSGLVAIVQASMTAFASRLRADQTTGTLEVMLSTPSPAWLTVVGGAAYAIIQMLAMELITLALAIGVFGMRLDTRPAGLVVLVAGIIVILGLFMALGLLVTAFTVIFKRGQGLATLLVSAFVLLGGAYYPLSVLPPGLRELGRVIPFTWALDLVRGCLVSGQAPLARLVELVAIDAVLLPLAIWTLGKAIDHTRRTGTLGQY